MYNRSKWIRMTKQVKIIIIELIIFEGDRQAQVSKKEGLTF